MVDFHLRLKLHQQSSINQLAFVTSTFVKLKSHQQQLTALQSLIEKLLTTFISTLMFLYSQHSAMLSLEYYLLYQQKSIMYLLVLVQRSLQLKNIKLKLRQFQWCSLLPFVDSTFVKLKSRLWLTLQLKLKLLKLKMCLLSQINMARHQFHSLPKT